MWHHETRDRREQLITRTKKVKTFFSKSFMRRVEVGLFKPGDLDKARRQLKELESIIDELEADARKQSQADDEEVVLATQTRRKTMAGVAPTGESK